MITTSVTLVESFRWWSESDLDWDWFLANSLSPSETWNMKAGKALHKALEGAREGEFDVLRADGFQFSFEGDYDLPVRLGAFQEVPCQKTYGDLTVRGRCDKITGMLVGDFKFRVGSVDGDKVEGYLDSYQWRFYLDMTSAKIFEYTVFEAVETSDPYIFVIRQIHSVKQYRYPDLEADCSKLAGRYMEAARTRPELVKTDAEPVRRKSVVDDTLITDDDLPAWAKG